MKKIRWGADKSPQEPTKTHVGNADPAPPKEKPMLRPEHKKQIEDNWLSIAKDLTHMGKPITPGTKTYRRLQRLYFAGAFNTLNACGIRQPPNWMIGMMGDRDCITLD